MNSFAIALPLALAYLRERPLATMLNILLLGLGVGTIIALALTLSQLEQRMARDAAGIDLVIGAKGSPLQLILSTVFQIDIATGNISVAEAAKVVADPVVKLAIPLALGDSFKTFRIVGTNAAYVKLYAASLQTGRLWQAPMEAVVGAEAARLAGLTTGMVFAGSHGLSDGSGGHAQHPYTVVGVLSPTGAVIDRLILTDVESVWKVHAHPAESAGDGNGNEVTAYLIQYATPLAAASFPRKVNAGSGLQSAAPAMETARLFNLLGVGINVIKSFAVVMMLSAAIGIFVGLMNALEERRADLALLRVLGAGRPTVFLTIITQGAVLGLAGVILGAVVGHAGAEWIGVALEKNQRLSLTGYTLVRDELWVAAGAMALALLAGVLPAWRAYRNAVPELLSRV